MAGLRDLEENIERLRKANDETRQITREAHEAIQTTKLVLAELREERNRWEIGIRDVVDRAVEKQVEMGLASFKEQVSTATHESYEQVVGEFDKLKNVLLYGNEKGKGQSLVEDWVEKKIQNELNKRLRIN